MSEENTSEEKLKKIIDVGKPKVITFNGERKYLSKDLINQIKNEREGGILPIIPIIAGILGASAAAAGTASGIASTVAKSREAQKKKLEIEKLQNELQKEKDLKDLKEKLEKEKLEKDLKDKEGSGLYYDKYFGKGLRDSILNSLEYKKLNKNDRKDLKELLNKFSKNKIKLSKLGKGIYFDLDDLN